MEKIITTSGISLNAGTLNRGFTVYFCMYIPTGMSNIKIYITTLGTPFLAKSGTSVRKESVSADSADSRLRQLSAFESRTAPESYKISHSEGCRNCLKYKEATNFIHNITQFVKEG
jgi:hypothetical protein